MATTNAAASIAPVLREAADQVAALSHARVVRSDVHHALRRAAASYGLAQEALVELIRHLRAVGRLDVVTRWSAPRNRDEVAADLRAAADAIEAEQERSQ
ncbi:hypothetical protein [Nonomuraea sp. 10N515B]|uniref:hypothetical protein n=1 Tax=Nonomuraea sp. 10N515B TaxID=3457422 RepID=UPI003FCE53B9